MLMQSFGGVTNKQYYDENVMVFSGVVNMDFNQI